MPSRDEAWRSMRRGSLIDPDDESLEIHEALAARRRSEPLCPELAAGLERLRSWRFMDREPEQLAKFGGAAIPPLLEILEHGEGPARAGAAVALRALRPRWAPVASALARRLTDPDAALVIESLRALQRLETWPAGVALRVAEGLRHRSDTVRQWTLHALRRHSDVAAPAVPIALEVLRHGSDWKGRRDILSLLARIGPGAAGALDDLLCALRHEPWNDLGLVIYTISRLGRKGRPAVEPLLALLESPDRLHLRRHVFAALGAIGDRRAGPTVFAHTLSEQEPGVLRPAVLALGRLRHRPAAKLVVHLADSEEPRLRRASLEALGLLRVRSAGVRRCLLRYANHRDWRTRLAAVSSIQASGLRGRAVRSALLDRLGDGSARVRAAAIAALLELGPEVQSAATALAKHGRRTVRNAAKELLAKLRAKSDVSG